MVLPDNKNNSKKEKITDHLDTQPSAFGVYIQQIQEVPAKNAQKSERNEKRGWNRKIGENPINKRRKKSLFWI